MSRVVVAAGIVGLLLFVEPPLDGLAGYLPLYVPPTTSRILLSAVPIDPEILEPIWRQLGVADRVLIDAYRGKSRRRELLPSGQPQCVKDPAAPSGHRL
jgi:hypothetical protein